MRLGMKLLPNGFAACDAGGNNSLQGLQIPIRCNMNDPMRLNCDPFLRPVIISEAPNNGQWPVVYGNGGSTPFSTARVPVSVVKGGANQSTPLW